MRRIIGSPHGGDNKLVDLGKSILDIRPPASVPLERSDVAAAVIILLAAGPAAHCHSLGVSSTQQPQFLIQLENFLIHSRVF